MKEWTTFSFPPLCSLLASPMASSAPQVMVLPTFNWNKKGLKLRGRCGGVYRNLWNSWDEPPLLKIEVKTSEFNHSPALFSKGFFLSQASIFTWLQIWTRETKSFSFAFRFILLLSLFLGGYKFSLAVGHGSSHERKVADLLFLFF